MVIKRKFFEDGAIRKEVMPGTKFGQPFKLVNLYDEYRTPTQSFEKPNFKLMTDPKLHVSGAHVLHQYPEQNHIENFNSTLGIERPKPGEIFQPSIISGFIPDEKIKFNKKCWILFRVFDI